MPNPQRVVPTPLPNIGRSADRLSDATSTVKIEGKKVAIKGSYYIEPAIEGNMAQAKGLAAALCPPRRG